MSISLHHFRVFKSVGDLGSITEASKACHITQSAVTQAMAKLETQARLRLLQRGSHGLTLTKAGTALLERVNRAFELLDPALADIGPRLKRTTTVAQLKALIALCEAENFTVAAKHLGLAQPTVHKSISQMERDANRPLFLRTPKGLLPTKPAQTLALKARLAFVELEQAEADLAEVQGREVGMIVVGAMPLSRSYVLPKAIARFRVSRPTLPLRVLEGAYDELLAGLKRGEIDVLIGALRDPAHLGDVAQEALFEDHLAFVARPGHPLIHSHPVTINQLAAQSWVVSMPGAPARKHFDAIFDRANQSPPASIVESGSMILMRELLRVSDHVGCVSWLQVAPEIAQGSLELVPFDLKQTKRVIGLTYRSNWLPTRAQSEFLAQLRATKQFEENP